MRVAQVTASIGETVVDHVHISPGERYAIGSAPAVQLAIAGLDAVPLVASEPRGFVVRRPIGLGTLLVDGRVCTDTEVLVGWERVVFAVGLATIEVIFVVFLF